MAMNIANTDILGKLAKLASRYDELTELMAQPEVAMDPARLQAYAREQASLEDLVHKYRDYQFTAKQIGDAQALLDEEADGELAELAREELQTLREREARLLEEISLDLLPKDPDDERDVIVEIRAGTGGEEAALFAGDLFRMYSRYAERHNWDIELVDGHETDLGGFKEVVFEVKGRGAYSRMKYESGVHRVQRVPTTEASGRIHTSTATVAVLPEVEDVDVDIKESDLRIDIYHSGGAGGQNVNKVATAVRITHFPTGIVVTCQDERSQLKNRTKAMAVLRARLYDMEKRKRDEALSQERRSQVGTAERSEKIRTYNFPQDRLTDHRIGLTVHSLARRLDGELDDIFDALAEAERQEQRQAAAATS